MSNTTHTPADALAEARELVAKDTVQLARDLFQQANSSASWDRADGPTKRDWILDAAAAQRDARLLVDAERARLAREASRKAKYDACDAYRAQIAGTVPAHRLDTRQNGFLDGWDAALAWAAQQATT